MGRIGRTHIYYKIIDVRIKRFETVVVIFECLLVRGVFIFSNVSSYQYPRSPFFQALYGCQYAFVVEAHSVDKGPVPGQPEQPRPVVAGLRLWREGADLQEPKS